jgi:hypothetical protein
MMRIHRNDARQTWEVWHELCVVAAFSKLHEAEAWVLAEADDRRVDVDAS